jgi:transcriptional regulator with XRE-family HTH domain
MSELGRLLAETRTANDLSLADVEAVIRVRQKYLEALESGDYATLPRGATSRGFLRNYARFLGIDVEQAMVLYATESGDRGPDMAIASGVTRTSDYRPLEVSLIDDRPRSPWWRWPLVVAVLALLVAAGWGFFGDRLNLPMPEFDFQLPALLAAREPTATPTVTATPPRVIAGWEQGVPGMKVGGIRRLILPPDLAYGKDGVPGTIPGNATIIFEVELLDAQ